MARTGCLMLSQPPAGTPTLQGGISPQGLAAPTTPKPRWPLDKGCVVLGDLQPPSRHPRRGASAP